MIFLNQISALGSVPTHISRAFAWEKHFSTSHSLAADVMGDELESDDEARTGPKILISNEAMLNGDLLSKCTDSS